MADYTVLTVGETDRWWTSMSLQEKTDGYALYRSFGEALAAGGHEVLGGAELQETARTWVVPAGGGAVTEGPYAETAEQVGGYHQIRTDDLDGLLECCQIVARTGDRVEVRPVVRPEDRPTPPQEG